MRGLDVQHHLGYGMFGGWRFDGGRAFAPLAKYVYIFLAALVVFFSFIIPGGIG